MGLDVERAMLTRLGNPETHFAVVHVAGTNGKGSVCALVDSMLRKAGFRTGLYTSPHLMRFHERIRVDGEPISDSELSALVGEVDKLCGDVERETGQEPTFFECATAMAFEHFRRADVQIAVVETGLGGRLDATNVVLPLLSVITRIDLEHSQYLGPDIATIAAEKCGIIKPGRLVVCGAMHPEALEVVRRTARERGSRVIEADTTVSVTRVSSGLDGQKIRLETAEGSYGTVQMPLFGRHQVENLATAVAAIEELRSMLEVDIDRDAVRQGIECVAWRGRCQVIESDPPVILDGAHNPGAAQALSSALGEVVGTRPLGLVVGMCDDKDAARFFSGFHGHVRRLWVVPLQSERNMPEETLDAAIRPLRWDVRRTSLSEAWEESRAWARSEGGAVCITGSLYLVGEVLAMLKRQEIHPNEKIRAD